LSTSRIGAALLAAAFVASMATPAFASTTPVRGVAPADRAFSIGVLNRPDVHEVGVMPGNATVQFSVNLKYQHAAELDRDIAAISTKGNPQYHHFLSNAQWNAYFAPSARQLQTVAQLLQRAGFQIDGVASNRSVVTAHGTAASVNRYFNTTMHLVSQDRVGIRYRNGSAATLPLEMRDLVIGVTGLNNVQFHISGVLHARTKPPVSSAIHSVTAAAPAIGGPVTAPDGGFGPVVLANGYDYPVQHGFNGQGHTVGVSIPSGFFTYSDTAAYEAYYGIKHTGHVKVETVDGGNPVKQYDGESTLDVETISGLAPGANVQVYIAPTWTVRYINDTFNQVVADNTVESISNSWGWCETQDAGDWDNASIHQIFQQGAMKGITFIFSSGDQGSNADGFPNCVASPTDDPYVVSIGGTHIDANSSGVITGQTGSWPDCGGIAFGAGSGGGVSAIYPLPSYQNGVAVSSAGRNVPDLSLPADCEDSWYIAGGWNGPIGGTSWGAPAFNAMLIEINQVLGSRSGWVNQSLYAANGTFGKAVFKDVLKGTNGTYNDTPGYDLVTGLGTPYGWALANYL